MPNVNVGTITISADAAEAGVLYLLANAVLTTTLASNMTASGTTGVSMVSADASGIAIGQAVAIAIEIFLVTGKSGNTLTVTRATVGTTAAVHTAGDQIRLLKQINLSDLCKAILKRAFAEALAAQGSSGVAAQQLIITNAQAAIEALKDGAVV